MPETSQDSNKSPNPFLGTGPQDEAPREKRDRSDFLSPILVKELRQGMRAKSFVFYFIVIQVMLVMYLVFALGSAERGNHGESSAFFWVILSVTLIVLMPLRGITALSSEIINETMELVLLTRMSAFRIVLGKWAALFFQTFLFVAAVFPYLVLRYFLGGVDSITDVTMLIILTVVSMILTGLSVSLSAFSDQRGRAVLIVGAIIGLVSMVGVVVQILEMMMFGRMSGMPGGVEALMLLGLIAIPATFIALEMSAGKIGPMVENHAARIRLLLVFIMAMGAFLPFNPDMTIFTTVVVGFIVIGVSVYNLVYPPVLISTVYQPFLRLGAAGKFIGRFLLYPGWPSGLFFTLAATISYFLLYDLESAFDNHYMIVWVSFTGSIFFFGIILKLNPFQRFGDLPFAVVVVSSFVVVAIMLWMLEEYFDIPCTLILAWSPVATIVFNIDIVNSETRPIYTVLSGIGGVVSLLLLLWRARKQMPAIFEMEEMAGRVLALQRTNKAAGKDLPPPPFSSDSEPDEDAAGMPPPPPVI